MSIAYRVLGDPDGPDVVFVPGFVSNIGLFSDIFWAAWQGLVDRTRFVVFDKRGTGLSDRSVGVADLETRMDDVRAVMDAAGIDRAHLIGVSEGGPMCVLFAATYPDRVATLSLVGSFARMTRSPTHPWLPDLEEFRATAALAAEYWGSGLVMGSFVPPDRMDELRPEMAAYEMGAASPAAVAAALAMNELIDVGDVLPSITVPTLVVHARHDRTAPIESGRYLAEHIPGARLVVEPEGDHLRLGPTPGIDAIIELVTGVQPAPVRDDRVLATVLFTDIVGSTERAAAEGDTAWRALLDRHDAVTRAAVEEHGGRTVKFTGDGYLARFDGPTRAVTCARAIGTRLSGVGLAIRAGLHTGEIEVRGEEIGGLAVHIAARVAARAGPGEVLVSRTVRDLTVGSDLAFEDRGEHDLKGVPDPWPLFALVP